MDANCGIEECYSCSCCFYINVEVMCDYLSNINTFVKEIPLPKFMCTNSLKCVKKKHAPHMILKKWIYKFCHFEWYEMKSSKTILGGIWNKHWIKTRRWTLTTIFQRSAGIHNRKCRNWNTGFKIQWRRTNLLFAFADDVDLTGNTRIKRKAIFIKFEKEAEEMLLLIDQNKTKYM